MLEIESYILYFDIRSCKRQTLVTNFVE